jgi:hypothetical protein
LPVTTSRAVFRMPVPAASGARTVASRFRDQVAAREQVGGNIPLRSAGQKLKFDYNIPTVAAQYLAKFKEIENCIKVITSPEHQVAEGHFFDHQRVAFPDGGGRSNSKGV